VIAEVILLVVEELHWSFCGGMRLVRQFLLQSGAIHDCVLAHCPRMKSCYVRKHGPEVFLKLQRDNGLAASELICV